QPAGAAWRFRCSGGGDLELLVRSFREEQVARNRFGRRDRTAVSLRRGSVVLGHVGTGSAAARGVDPARARRHGFPHSLRLMRCLRHLLLAAEKDAALPTGHDQSGGASGCSAGRRVFSRTDPVDDGDRDHDCAGIGGYSVARRGRCRKRRRFCLSPRQNSMTLGFFLVLVLIGFLVGGFGALAGIGGGVVLTPLVAIYYGLPMHQ